jgi:drug/metabolite transporter (DMT)-like permease
MLRIAKLKPINKKKVFWVCFQVLGLAIVFAAIRYLIMGREYFMENLSKLLGDLFWSAFSAWTTNISIKEQKKLKDKYYF